MAYTKTYTKKNFVNGQSPSINATNLNAIETTLDALESQAYSDSRKIDTLQTEVGSLTNTVNSKANQSELNTLADTVRNKADKSALTSEIITRKAEDVNLKNTLDEHTTLINNKYDKVYSHSSAEVVDDSDDGLLKNVKIKGKSERQNMFAYASSISGGQIVNGHIKNTSTDTRNYLSLRIKKGSANWDATTITTENITSVGSKSFQFTVSAEDNYYFIHNGENNNIGLFSVYLGAGTYTFECNAIGINSASVGGIDLSDVVICSKIVSVKNPTITCIKSLCDWSDASNTIYAYGSGDVITSSAYYGVLQKCYAPNKTVTLTYESDMPVDSLWCAITVYDESGNYVRNVSKYASYTDGKKLYTTLGDGEYYASFCLYCSSGANASTFRNVIFTDDVDAKKSVTLSTTLYGIGSVCDYVDVERGKIVRNIYKGTVGTLAQSGQTTSSMRVAYFDFSVSGKGSYGEYIQALTEKAKCVYSADSIKTTEYALGARISGDQNSIVTSYFSAPIGKSLADMQTMFGNSTVMFAKSTPTEENIPTDKLALLKALSAYYPSTTVTITSDEINGSSEYDYPLNLESFIRSVHNGIQTLADALGE